ncbi:VPLPA-CTERM sorting domain-containing protein [uncultured Roseobacter sp.]|uniref:VPLPA-CTERM sorting domain-containing protein n=1 Tax=uncultured Roseobacter sp. TaxID=114847 RepID=UPI00262D4D1F|nr:VPLPA-CTERM sorting domain-containing protein [uncultured Roseobacter sp.]
MRITEVFKAVVLGAALVAGSAVTSDAASIQALSKSTPATASNELAQVIAELDNVGVDTTGFKALGRVDGDDIRLGGLTTYSSEAGIGEELDFQVTFGTAGASELLSVGGGILDTGFSLEAVLIVDGTHSAIWYDGMFSDMFVLDAGGKRKGISHVSYFGTMTAVPLPAGAVLLLSGLGGLTVLRRRKRA